MKLGRTHLLFAFGSLAIWLAALPVMCANRDVCSTCAYTTIQSAVDSAASGDVVRVASSTYAEIVYMNQVGKSFALEGGYNDSFTARLGESILQGYIQIGSASNVSIDRMTITNSSQAAIYAFTDATIQITNCKLHDNAQYGIFLYQSGEAVITGNEIYSNGTYGGIGIVRGSGSSYASEISSNTIYSHTCSYCAGIDIGQAVSGDIITGNTIYSNETGIRIRSLSTSESPEISFNELYSNRDGIYAMQGNYYIHHNRIYRNTLWGVFLDNSGNSTALNNTFVSNGNRALHYVGGTGSPSIRNNIFYGTAHGLCISGNSAGGGGTSVVPSELNNNAFFNSHFTHSSLPPSYSFPYEEPGSFGYINGQAWTNENVFVDPRFVDVENDDFHLRTDSFLIDEGDATDDFSNEPAPNGSRINIGAYGNTSAETATAAAITITSVSAEQQGADLSISFNTNTSVHDLWVSIEYFGAGSYHAIGATQLSGDSYRVGYKTGRIVSGAGQSLLWSDAASVFGGIIGTTRIRVTIEHGTASAVAESGDIAIDFISTPTATPSPSPSSTPTATPTATATATPEETSTPLPSPQPSASPSPPPEVTPQAPIVEAANANVRLRNRLVVPISVQDSDSSSVTLRAYWIRGKEESSLGSVQVSAPFVENNSINFGRKSLSVGKWRYCVKSKDDSGLSGNKSCARLVVRR